MLTRLERRKLRRNYRAARRHIKRQRDAGIILRTSYEHTLTLLRMCQYRNSKKLGRACGRLRLRDTRAAVTVAWDRITERYTAGQLHWSARHAPERDERHAARLEQTWRSTRGTV